MVGVFGGVAGRGEVGVALAGGTPAGVIRGACARAGAVRVSSNTSERASTAGFLEWVVRPEHHTAGALASIDRGGMRDPDGFDLYSVNSASFNGHKGCLEARRYDQTRKTNRKGR